MALRKKIHTIAHTHWDYEWYFTQNESQIQLDYHMGEVIKALDKNLLNTYLLDGQSSLVEDHLVNCPENREAITRLVKDKRLLIGPWYTQSDLMIVAGEAIVKNLQLGINTANSLGHSFDIGYVPDSFGQSQDMPKIFNGFGYDQYVFWRGLSSSTSPYREFIWSSEDGSSLTCYNIKEGYYPGGTIIWGEQNHITPTANACITASHFEFGVFPVGGDQRYVDFDFREKIAKANRENNRYKFVESQYADVFADIDKEKLHVIQGEMLDSENSKIHRSIYSSRYDHKFLNDRVERKLIYTLEPLMAMGSTMGLQGKRGSLDSLWKVVLKNHAHDSACGCNSDKTNYQILSRFISANEQVDAHIDYIIRKIAEATPGQNSLTLFNTLPVVRENNIRATISTNQPCFALEFEGQTIPFDIEEVRKVYCGSIQRNEVDNDPDLYYYETDVVFCHPLKPLSYLNIQVVEGGASPLSSSFETIENQSIEDSFYKLAFEAGQLTLLDKKTSTKLTDFLALVDQADDGDTYDYSPLSGDKPLIFDLSDAVFSVKKHQLSSTVKIKGKLKLPEQIEQYQRSKTLIDLPYELHLTLENDGLLSCKLVTENTCKDHRLRVRIHSGLNPEKSFSDTPFGCIDRPVYQAEMDNWQELGWNEEPTGIYPMLNMVNVHDDNVSVTAFTKGIKEYEITGEQNEFIELTAFRSVGFLGKPGLQRRPGKASGNEYRYIPTPDSQLLQRIECEFALSIDSAFNPGQLRKQHQNWVAEILHYQKQELNRFTGPLKYFVSNRLPVELDSEYQLFKSVSFSESVVCTMFKLADDGKSHVLRILNNCKNTENVAVQVEFNRPPISLIETDLTETTVIKALDNTISLSTMKPGEIKTFLIETGV